MKKLLLYKRVENKYILKLLRLKSRFKSSMKNDYLSPSTPQKIPALVLYLKR